MIVGVRGGGVAAAACAHLLGAAGHRVAHEPAPRPQVPSVMLSAAALALVRDVFGRSDLFADRPRVTRRVVAWGGQEPVTVPHDAILVSDRDLHEALASDCPGADAGENRDFTIFTAPPMPEGELRVFGDRHAVAAQVALRDPAARGECRIEALPAGWLFLAPGAEGQGWLLGFGAPLEELVGQSRLVGPAIDLRAARSAPFVTAPRLHLPLAGAGWLACGTAALGFDPICGDGTAQAVREAVLASAVIDAAAGGADRAALLAHYQAMLVAAMRRHLQLCARFYETGGQGEWWRAQSAALARGHALCTAYLAREPEPRFVLRGFRLEPRALAA
ncbi:hypothetical protein [Novosphingobium album (ex Liu et al. 2023)]|uniref:NAD(P)/FAD-dependent oxidoreductase n=1 Tax=Novosphingobium album (ex Liu et al. 2023) TaxID=3031130 RepID=A0ABT5WUM3_9SPHN|nr:hypothetical protein [Novosphingobium album (ex Liu et al. 2023)]MDE8653578.1 hypothetical protein [Novosphingobium album (ex Liu et al. 2023)]